MSSKFVIFFELLLSEAQILDDVSVFDVDLRELPRNTDLIRDLDVTDSSYNGVHSLQTLELTTVDMHEKGNSSGKTDIHNLGKGTVRLYKHHSHVSNIRIGAENVLGIMAIPAYLTSVDLLNYFGDNIRSIRCFRMVKAGKNCHFALLKFYKAQDAHVFRNKFDGARYNVGSISFLYIASDLLYS